MIGCAVVLVFYFAQFSLLTSMTNILSAVAGKNSVPVAMRRTHFLVYWQPSNYREKSNRKGFEQKVSAGAKAKDSRLPAPTEQYHASPQSKDCQPLH